MSRSMNRRRFLRGMAGGATVTLALPIFDLMLDDNGAAFAQGSAFPTRFGLFTWGNGILPARWIPQGEGDGDAWQLSEQLAPLAGVKDVISVVSGLAIKTPNVIPHHSGSAGILTGQPLWVKSHDYQTFYGPSVDQIIAQEIGGETRFRSLEFGANPGGGLSHIGPDNVNPPEREPAAFFERIFGPDFRAPGDDAEPDPKLALRRSVLDAVMADAATFKRDLGMRDRQRLDQHLTGIRELELRIARLQDDPPDLEACSRPDAPMDAYPDVDGRPQLSARNRALCDIAVMALACDQTRVFSNFVTKPLTNLLLAGSSSGHHQLTHDEPGEQPQVNAIVISLMEELAYLVDRLRSIPEGDGTLLDHMVLFATSDVSYGRTHALDEFPIIIAGRANGRLRTGLHYRSALGENTSKAVLSVIRATGINAGHFGAEAGRVEDSLGAIEA